MPPEGSAGEVDMQTQRGCSSLPRSSEFEVCQGCSVREARICNSHLSLSLQSEARVGPAQVFDTIVSGVLALLMAIIMIPLGIPAAFIAAQLSLERC